MLNVFPRAETALIESTIGMSRPSAHPPERQAPVHPQTPPSLQDFHPFRVFPPWFKRDAISSYEARLFKNPNYLAIRNRILSLYEDGAGCIFLGMCRGLGPFSLVLRIFDFLEDSKLINYEVQFKQALRDFTTSPNRASPACSSQQARIRHRHVASELLQSSRCICGRQAGHFTSDLYFVCAECFEAGHYPTRYGARNFHRISQRLINCLWTKQDDYRLLKNINLFGDDWERVAEGLNKSADQCIFHFLKMSLFDECNAFPAMCFSSVPNPVATLVAYVSFMVHPAVAAEMAKAAIKYMERADLLDILIAVGVRKAKDALELERAKKARLEQVETEALAIRLSLKIDAICEMNTEMTMVRMELEDMREKLADEIAKKY